MATYTYTELPYRRPPELGGPGARRPVVIVGAGPVGLAAAIDLASRGIASVVIDDNNVVSVGSRAICWAKRTLEILDRLGVAERMVAKGVTWRIGRVYHGDRELYHFDLLPEGGHKMPAFINLQQYYVEEFLVDRAAALGDRIDLRWKNRLVGVTPLADGVVLDIDTPDGRYRLEADWVIAADGARSTVRSSLGLPFAGRNFEEKFLIVDVRLAADYPSDRRFWFSPTFDRGESVLMHRQPDDVFRIDFQLGPDADAELERDPRRAMERVRGVVGPDVDCTFEWCSVYTFRCVRMPRFIAGRVLFAGDAAHVVSPFGARGGNGGIQDVDNLCWKLAAVIAGAASPAFLDTYDVERGHGADENLMHSARTTTFMTPKSTAERELRDAVLALAPHHAFARSLVNSGRLSRPCSLAGLPSLPADRGEVGGLMVAGSPCTDAPLRDAAGRHGWLLSALGPGPTVLVFADDVADVARIAAGVGATGIEGLAMLVVAAAPVPGAALSVWVDAEGLARARYGGAPGVTYLVRPDQHVHHRWPRWDPAQVGAAWRTCLAGGVA